MARILNEAESASIQIARRAPHGTDLHLYILPEGDHVVGQSRFVLPRLLPILPHPIPLLVVYFLFPPHLLPTFFLTRHAFLPHEKCTITVVAVGIPAVLGHRAHISSIVVGVVTPKDQESMQVLFETAFDEIGL